MASASTGEKPIFGAVSNSTRHIFQLLRCINFAAKANVRINDRGIQVAVQDSKAIQGQVFLSKELFSSYAYNFQQIENLDNEENDADSHNEELPGFGISLDSLLETLQIFGLSEGKDKWATRDYSSFGGVSGFGSRGDSAAAFDNQTLRMTGLCKFSYEDVGSPLCVVLEETGVTTSCELNTYESDDFEPIPFNKEDLVYKIIMRASWLHDAIEELSATSPERIAIVVSPAAPYFALSAVGPLGSANVEFDKDRQLLEIFEVGSRWVNTYKYAFVKSASRAMAMASKVSIRGDPQGVLSLQFMIDMEEGMISFVDFRFVAFLDDEEEEDADTQDRHQDKGENEFDEDGYD